MSEEAGRGKSLLDKVHGAETTGSLYLEVPTQASRAGGEVALPQDGAAVMSSTHTMQEVVCVSQTPSGFVGTQGRADVGGYSLAQICQSLDLKPT